MIPVSKPSIGKEELDLIAQVFLSNWLGQGKYVKDFESEISNYLGVKNVIAVNNCTSALHLCLEVNNIGEGDEVIVPSQTFAASIQAILMTGAKPVFCEIAPENFCLDLVDLESKISDKTRAIMPVHMYGLTCKMDSIIEIAKPNNIIVIEDAAHAFGSEYKGKKIGSFGHMTCFSFDPIKNITCGDGGAICTNDDQIAVLLRRKRNIGQSDNRHKNQDSEIQEHQIDIIGYRYHMNNINAAIGLEQLKKLNKFKLRKQEIVTRYNSSLASIKEIVLLDWNVKETFPFTYTMRVQNKLRDKLVLHLRKMGIQTAINYRPNHLQPAFKNLQNLPVTEELYDEMISLPLFYDLTDKEVSYIINSVMEFFMKK